jgi:hypothetical protein
VGGGYCSDELRVYQDALILKVKFPDDPVVDGEYRAAKLNYDNCSTKHNADRVLVNPFNKIRDLGENHE